MLIRVFPLLAASAALFAYFFPTPLIQLKQTIVPLLMLVMLSMGLSLSINDFKDIRHYRGALLAGFLLQFSVMPLTALALSYLFSLPEELTVGMLLVGCVAGGTASNVMTFLARGHVALSVSMTAVSTLASVICTPLLMLLLTGSSVDINALAMLKSLLMIVLLPVCAGLVLNSQFQLRVDSFRLYFAPLAVAAIVLIIAIVVALNAGRIANVSWTIILVPLIHNLTGLCFGYWAGVLLGFDSKIRRTLAIEVGMQNSGLATALALKFFSPAAAVPGAIFSVWLNISGSVFAAFMRRQDKVENDQPS